MAEPRILHHVTGPAEGLGMLCPDTAPVIRGHGTVDYICPRCGATLIERVHARQLFDLAVRCPHCETESLSDMRPPGCPLAGRPVLIPAGRFRLSRALDLPGPVMMAGQMAIDEYARETGARWGISRGTGDPVPRGADTDGFNGLADELVALLGDRYEKLLGEHRRGRSSPTPPRNPHRLMDLIDYARRAAFALSADVAPDHLELDGDLISEIVATVSMYERWRFHPAWPALVAATSQSACGWDRRL